MSKRISISFHPGELHLELQQVDSIRVPFRHSALQKDWITRIRAIGHLAEEHRYRLSLSIEHSFSILRQFAVIGEQLAQLLFTNESWPIVKEWLRNRPAIDIEIRNFNYMWIPWEIFYLGHDTEHAQYQDFCGYQRTLFRVPDRNEKTQALTSPTKWAFLPFSGWSKNAMMSEVKDIEEVSCTYLSDKLIRKEFSPLNPEIERKREIKRLRRYLENVDIIHFSCLINSVFEKSFLLLDSTFWLSIEDLTKRVQENRKFKFNNSPLVFFNVRDNYTRHPLHILRYVRLFHDLEALGVITSTLPIPDYLAAQFSEQFYRNLLQDGQFIGQALAQTKQYFMDNFNNPFALFYVPYLAPSTKIIDSTFIVDTPFPELQLNDIERPLSQPSATFDTETPLIIRKQPPFAPAEKKCTFSIACNPGSNIKIQASGAVNLRIETSQPLLFDKKGNLARVGKIDSVTWRSHIKQQGKELYQQVFEEHSQVIKNYEHISGIVGTEHLHLRLESRSNLLQMPLEYLFDVDDGGYYLVLKHPFARSISGIRTINKSLSPDFLNNLHANGKKLRILLISSSTPPHLPSIDQEIQEIHALLHHLFAKQGIVVEITRLSSERATYQRVRRELMECKYHVIHYAGHGIYDDSSPEKSSLLFWEKNNWSGKVMRMPVSELNRLLVGSNTRFVYLSCCLASATANEKVLLTDDFLGIADGLIRAKVPSVLGYRWPVSDSRAKEMALAFYRSLAKHGQIDMALLHARRELAAQNRDDMTWLSPILIMQG